jgi:hypothetical protein
MINIIISGKKRGNRRSNESGDAPKAGNAGALTTVQEILE